LTENSVEFAASEFKVDDPIRDDPVERSFFPELDAEMFVIPELITEPFEEGKHLNGLNFIKVEQFVEQFEVELGVHHLATG
jgi:hypothetical protein